MPTSSELLSCWWMWPCHQVSGTASMSLDYLSCTRTARSSSSDHCAVTGKDGEFRRRIYWQSTNFCQEKVSTHNLQSACVQLQVLFYNISKFTQTCQKPLTHPLPLKICTQWRGFPGVFPASVLFDGSSSPWVWQWSGSVVRWCWWGLHIPQSLTAEAGQTGEERRRYTQRTDHTRERCTASLACNEGVEQSNCIITQWYYTKRQHNCITTHNTHMTGIA